MSRVKTISPCQTVTQGVQGDRVRFPEVSADFGELQFDQLTGVSVCALATAWTMGRFSTAIDMGRCSASLASQQTVLLTHCHSDHVAGLIAYLSARTRRHRNHRTQVFVPDEKRDPLVDALECWPDLDGVRRRIDLGQTLEGARPGTRVDIRGGRAVAFRTRHNTVSLGWSLVEEGKSRPTVIFTGDSTIEPFQDDPSLLDGAMAVVDCSFIEPGTRVAARLGGHAHLSDWLELLPELTCDQLVLAHLPSESTAANVLKHLPEDLPGTATVIPWVVGPDGN